MFRAQIILIESPGPDEKDGTAIVNLAEPFPTKAEAEKMAWLILNVLRRPVGTATYRIFDSEGRAC